MFDSSVRTTLLFYILGIVGIAWLPWLQTTAALDYCQLNCGNETHVMCKYPPGPNEVMCTGYMHKSLTQEEKEQILSDHNHLRQLLAVGNETLSDFALPPASNMMQLLWDEELARIAQRIVDQCPREATLEQCVVTDRFYVNQMIITLENMQNLETLIREFVKNWYNGKRTLTANELQRIGSTRADKSHLPYTQIVWAQSEFIGCAHAAWMKDGVTPMQQIVCNYGPAGNVLNENVYRTGTPCSQCPLGAECSQQYPGLCVRFLL